jgi:hypothetical protein
VPFDCAWVAERTHHVPEGGDGGNKPEGTSPGPEEVGRLNDSYKRTLRALNLIDRNDPLSEIVAKKVIEIGLDGICAATDIAKSLGLP